MNNKLQTLPLDNLPANATVFAQTGERSVQVAQANNVNNVVNLIIPMMSTGPGGFVNRNVALNMDYYNLFVIGDETFCGGHFTVPKDRALTESMSSEVKAQFAALGEDAISQIKTFPSLFASENHGYGKTDDAHQACFGIVTDVKIQDNGIKIHFHPLWAVPQQKLNEIAFNIALQGASSFNELNRTHWAIKKVNLIEELKAAGISVLAPT
ncbi:hypothetical protein JT05_06610 [Desulfosporosinus sp. Tol-M]|nr:hypothetical protein JT05_06610 [Desulfosporosinus sp. Tol-M]